jgi:hypothetical protein
VAYAPRSNRKNGKTRGVAHKKEGDEDDEEEDVLKSFEHNGYAYKLGDYILLDGEDEDEPLIGMIEGITRGPPVPAGATTGSGSGCGGGSAAAAPHFDQFLLSLYWLYRWGVVRCAVQCAVWCGAVQCSVR